MPRDEASSTESSARFDVIACLEVVDSICEQWQQVASPGGSPISTTRKDLDKAYAILGLASHALCLGPEIVNLIRAGKSWVATPLVRLCFECGITAQWIRHVDDGFAAFAYEGYRQRRSLYESIKTSEMTIEEPLNVSFSRDMQRWLSETKSQQNAKDFIKKCKDLEPGGPTYYAIYRFLSAGSHASLSIVDAHFVLDDSEPDAIPAYSMNPNSNMDSVVAYSVAASVIWAGRALGMVLKQGRALKAFRSEIYAAGQSLGIVPDLKLSESAWLRLNRPAAGRAAT